MTELDIQEALIGHRPWNMWNYGQVKAARNSVSALGYEADLLILQDSGYFWEIEIKISLADFKADLKKPKHQILLGKDRLKKNYVRQFWYAVPEELWPKIENLVPDHAGVIVVAETRRGRRTVLSGRKVRPGPVLAAEKATETQKELLMTTCYYSCWKMFELCQILKRENTELRRRLKEK